MQILRLLFLGGFLFGQAIAAGAGSWPEIPEKERKLRSVPEFPNAAAVVLYRQGKVHLSKDSRSSYLDVYTRIKILTREGVDYGSLELNSSDYLRVKDLQGRTHLPDGSIVELSKDAKFKKEFSDYYGTSLVSCAMPEVVTGSIIEYRYRTYFDSIFFPKAWYFQAEIPTLCSSVTFVMPHNITFVPLVYKTLKKMDFREKVDQNVEGGKVTYTAYNLPPVPDEPSRFPFRDLATHVMLLPTQVRDGSGMQTPLFDNWKDAISLVWGYKTWGYGNFFSDVGKAKKIAKSLRTSGDRLEDARRVFRWVRDEIQTEYVGNVWVADRTADDIIKNGKGDLTEKALLLYVMLKAVKIHSDPVWINPKTRNRVDQNVPNPTQFFRVVIRAEIGGRTVFLDPCDRELAFGQLSPSMQGVPAMIVRRKKPEWITTPLIPAKESLKKVDIELVLDREGKASGSGHLELSGNHAWMKLGWKDTEEESRSAWKKWIEDHFPGFDISDVSCTESIDEQHVGVHWTMKQREESILADEFSLLVSEPLRQTSNPYTLAPNRRWTPALLLFPDEEVLDLRIIWPEGWAADVIPALRNFENDAGSLHASVEIDEAAREAHISRKWTIKKTEFFGADAYATLRDLFEAVTLNDAEELVLVAE